MLSREVSDVAETVVRRRNVMTLSPGVASTADKLHSAYSRASNTALDGGTSRSGVIPPQDHRSKRNDGGPRRSARLHTNQRSNNASRNVEQREDYIDLTK